LKIKINPNSHQYAIECSLSYGPIFGVYDIVIANNANTTLESSSHLGDCYSHPQYRYGTNEAASFLAGSGDFLLDEIEVYQKEE
jgi:hypothetical protein